MRPGSSSEHSTKPGRKQRVQATKSHMKNTQPYIKIGKLGSSYGVRGWIKVQSYTEFGLGILDYKPWLISRDDIQWKPIEVESGRAHGNGIVVKFVGIETPEDAAKLTGNLIGVPRDRLPPTKENEYYWNDLEGATVIDKDGNVLGKVIYLMETGSNDVLVVKGEKEHAIPFLPGDVILSVDLEKKEIHVDWEPLV